MVECTKCRGPLRYDWQFPVMVCQMCGVVYYLQPNYELPKVGVCTVPRGGWHQSRAACTTLWLERIQQNREKEQRTCKL